MSEPTKEAVPCQTLAGPGGRPKLAHCPDRASRSKLIGEPRPTGKDSPEHLPLLMVQRRQVGTATESKTLMTPLPSPGTAT
eukprot:CAMPEP_0171102670 /NCGR_PEP_ID=MMETSP0766_2-20121228/58438_1 /TAXON_ID=439317 /ORGANISM="Gambierdiscus australes, Strain CAWD 149" /LENGTH=80 /DNA_ID=CAMNT_0011563001 /DNA_START=63 /DNA_END=301 /DNA_ORIENTATION=+